MGLTLSILVNDIGTKNDPTPQFLVDRNGAWQDYKTGTLDPTLAEMREKLGDQLNLLMQLVEADPAVEVLSSLQAICDMLYEQVMPADLRKVLEQAAAAAGDPPVLRLHVGPKFDWIPWELMRTPAGYLGVLFEVARVPISPSVPVLDEANPHTVQVVHNLLGQCVLETSPALIPTWQTTFEPPATVQQVLLPDNGGAGPHFPTIEDCRKALAADILHLTCHGMYDSGRQIYYWAVDPNSPKGFVGGIWGGFFAGLNLLGGRPLVFANACATPLATGLMPGFGRELFARGAQNAIGAVARLSRATAVPFAKEFYRCLLVERLPIGRALLETKQRFHKGATEPSHLFYCLYGPPGTRFQYA